LFRNNVKKKKKKQLILLFLHPHTQTLYSKLINVNINALK